MQSQNVHTLATQGPFRRINMLVEQQLGSTKTSQTVTPTVDGRNKQTLVIRARWKLLRRNSVEHQNSKGDKVVGHLATQS